MSVYHGNSSLYAIVKGGLTVNLDAGNKDSYISGSTTWYDLTGNNSSGSLINGPTFSATNGGSIVFDGTNDYVEISTLATSSWKSDWTIMGWAYPTLLSDLRGIFGWGENAVLGTFDTKMVWYPGSGLLVTGSTVLSTNQYYHFAFKYKAIDKYNATRYLYLNGKLDIPSGTYVNPLLGGTGNNSYVGKSVLFGSDRQFKGNISNYMFYNRMLSDAEILQNYNANKDRYASSITSYSSIPNISKNGLITAIDPANLKSYVSGGTVLNDLSGTGSWTLANGPAYSSINKGSISFDGSNDFGYTNISYGSPAQFTLSTWFKTTDANGRKILGFENSQISAASQYDKMLYIGTDGKLYFGCYFPGTTAITYLTSSVALNNGNWHYAAGMYNGDATRVMSLYIDGALVGSKMGGGTIESYAGYFKLGGSKLASWPNAGDGYWSGNIGLTAIYNRPLSAYEIVQNYNTTKGRYGL